MQTRVGYIGVGLMGHGAACPACTVIASAVSQVYALANLLGHQDTFMPALPGILAELAGVKIHDLKWSWVRSSRPRLKKARIAAAFGFVWFFRGLGSGTPHEPTARSSMQ